MFSYTMTSAERVCGVKKVAVVGIISGGVVISLGAGALALAALGAVGAAPGGDNPASDLVDTFVPPAEPVGLTIVRTVDLCGWVDGEIPDARPIFNTERFVSASPGVVQDVSYVDEVTLAECELYGPADASGARDQLSTVRLAFVGGEQSTGDDPFIDYRGFRVEQMASGGTRAFLGDGLILSIRSEGPSVDDLHIFGELPLIKGMLDAWVAERVPTMGDPVADPNAVSICERGRDRLEDVAPGNDIARASYLLDAYAAADFVARPWLSIRCALESDGLEHSYWVSYYGAAGYGTVSEALAESSSSAAQCPPTLLGDPVPAGCKETAEVVRYAVSGDMIIRYSGLTPASVDGPATTQELQEHVTVLDERLQVLVDALTGNQYNSEWVPIDPRQPEWNDAGTDPTGIDCEQLESVWSVSSGTAAFALCYDPASGLAELVGSIDGDALRAPVPFSDFEACAFLEEGPAVASGSTGTLCVTFETVRFETGGAPSVTVFREYVDVAWVSPALRGS